MEIMILLWGGPSGAIFSIASKTGAMQSAHRLKINKFYISITILNNKHIWQSLKVVLIVLSGILDIY